jgi:hypothetical protein
MHGGSRGQSPHAVPQARRSARTIEEKRIDSNGKGIDALLLEGCECHIDLGNGTRVEDYDLPPDIGSRGPNVVQ